MVLRREPRLWRKKREISMWHVLLMLHAHSLDKPDSYHVFETWAQNDKHQCICRQKQCGSESHPWKRVSNLTCTARILEESRWPDGLARCRRLQYHFTILRILSYGRGISNLIFWKLWSVNLQCDLHPPFRLLERWLGDRDGYMCMAMRVSEESFKPTNGHLQKK